MHRCIGKAHFTRGPTTFARTCDVHPLSWPKIKGNSGSETAPSNKSGALQTTTSPHHQPQTGKVIGFLPDFLQPSHWQQESKQTRNYTRIANKHARNNKQNTKKQTTQQTKIKPKNIRTKTRKQKSKQTNKQWTNKETKKTGKASNILWHNSLICCSSQHYIAIHVQFIRHIPSQLHLRQIPDVCPETAIPWRFQAGWSMAN